MLFLSELEDNVLGGDLLEDVSDSIELVFNDFLLVLVQDAKKRRRRLEKCPDV